MLLLVVAADDGVMPQTREHLDIVDLLGISQGMVAITKIDLVDKETVALASEEVRELLEGTSLEGAPVVPVSSITGEGYDRFWSTLSDVVHDARRKNVEGPFRLPVERVFSVKGHGAVITGTHDTLHKTEEEKCLDEDSDLKKGFTKVDLTSSFVAGSLSRQVRALCSVEPSVLCTESVNNVC